MINLGQILLSLALAIAAVQFCSGVFRLKINQIKLTKVLFTSLTVCFIFLIYKYIISDFSYLNVYENSHTAKPLLYKITGVWANHEGSMLLFILIISLYSFIFSIKSKSQQSYRVAFFQSFILLLLLFYVYFFSNPFDVNPMVLNGLDVSQGRGLNPLLQDIGLAIHPPVLYFGYAGFSLPFSYSLVALKREISVKEFAEEIRNYTLFAWAFLGLGIALGSWWAYRELGWGGFWFWDPVENSSLVPWLFGSALLHSAIYTRKFSGYVSLTMFLSLICFLMSLIGFFLVRSGILSSVHSFASDPNRGLVMLAIIFILGTYSMYIFGKNIFGVAKKPIYQYKLLSRQVHIGLNITFFIVLSFTILLGLFYPIILELFDINSISVGAPYFEKIFIPIVVGLAILAVFTPYIKWHQNKLSKIFRVLPSFILSLIFTSISYFCIKSISFISLISLFSGFLLFLSMLEIYVLRIFDKNGKITRGLNVLFLSHGGFGLLVIFVTLLVNLQSVEEIVISKEKPFSSPEMSVQLIDSNIGKRDNYLYQNAKFKISDDKENIHINPENRVYMPSAKKTYEVDIKTDLYKDYYAVMSDSKPIGNGNYEFYLRFYEQPFMLYIWLSMLMVSLGGFIATIPRKK